MRVSRGGVGGGGRGGVKGYRLVVAEGWLQQGIEVVGRRPGLPPLSAITAVL